MSILSDKEIREREGMITPFSEGSKGISSGVSSYGYDAKLFNKIYLFKKTATSANQILDPKNFDTTSYEEIISDDHFILGPHEFALGRTVEYFSVPKDILVICLGKSTYARCGLVVNVTPLEPGWTGYVTLEFSNTTDYPIKMYPNEGICQFIFLKADNVCERAYDQRSGKYMDQQDIVLAKHE